MIGKGRRDDHQATLLISVKTMQNDDLNPYDPPTQVTAPEDAGLHSAIQDYRIEKKVMILPPPFVLPAVCFLTGDRDGLRRCEIPLKVMPMCWKYAMPVVMVSLQGIVMLSSVAIQKLNLNLPGWFVPPLAGAAIGVIIPALSVISVLCLARKITLSGFWNESGSVYSQRRQYVIYALLLDGLLLILTAATCILFDDGGPVLIIALIAFVVAFIVTLSVWLRNRNPWSRIGALRHGDGTLAIYGLDPSFLAVCRLGLVESTAPATTPKSA